MKMKDLFPDYFRYLELNNKKQSVYKIKKRLEKVSNYFNKNIKDITKRDILKFKISIDSDYSYRQYLLEKMEEECNEQNENI